MPYYYYLFFILAKKLGQKLEVGQTGMCYLQKQEKEAKVSPCTILPSLLLLGSIPQKASSIFADSFGLGQVFTSTAANMASHYCSIRHTPSLFPEAYFMHNFLERIKSFQCSDTQLGTQCRYSQPPPNPQPSEEN